jgi:hypothetical protein
LGLSWAIAEWKPDPDAAATLEAMTALIKRRRESCGFTAVIPAFLAF